MSTFVAGSALMLGLLVPVVIRIFMKKRAHIDTAVVLIPVSVIMLIVYICAFGVQLFTVLLTILELLVFLTNFRALQRYINGLYVDYFHIPFVISTVLCALAILFLSFLLYWFAPRKDMDIIITIKDRPAYTVTRTLYTGSAYQGLTEKQGFMEQTAAVAKTWTPDNDDDTKPLIVCFPDICIRASDYEPLMRVLAERGYLCTTADITTADTAVTRFNGTWIRPFIMRVKRMEHPDTFTEMKAECNQKKVLEEIAYIKALKARYPGRKILVAADETYALIYREKLEDVKTIHLNLDGLGFLPLTHPLDAACLLPEKYPFSERRTSDMMVYRTADYIIGESK